MSCTSSPASSAALPLCSASRRTSSATTANPLPCFPARAAPMAALSASRFVMSASSRIEAMNPVIRRLTCPSCCTWLEASPTNALRATSRPIASLICPRFLFATSLAVVEARAASVPSSDTRRDTWARLSVASSPPETSPSSARTPWRTRPVDGATAPAAARHVVDHHRLARPGHVLAQRLGVRRRLPALGPADLPPIREQDHAFLPPVDPEVAPVDQAVRQALDARERVLQADVARDHRLHGVDLVELFGGDRFFQGVLEEQTQGAQCRRHERPGERRPIRHRAHDDARGDQGGTVADALVAQDEQPLVLLELAANDQGEVEQQPADDEIREGVRSEEHTSEL